MIDLEPIYWEEQIALTPPLNAHSNLCGCVFRILPSSMLGTCWAPAGHKGDCYWVDTGNQGKIYHGSKVAQSTQTP